MTDPRGGQRRNGHFIGELVRGDQAEGGLALNTLRSTDAACLSHVTLLTS